MKTKSLTELANRCKSDKGNEYKCAHYYTQYYEEIFSVYGGKRIDLLEIGLNRDDCSDVPSLRMYREYFGKRCYLAGFDIRPEFNKFKENGFDIIIGDQSNPDDLAKCKHKKWTIIIDDGSHASSHQQITLQELWECVEPGGTYVIEDLHWQPFMESCPKTVELAREWINGNPFSSAYISEQKIKQIIQEAASIELMPSHSTLHDPSLTKQALLVIKKKP